MKNEFETVPYRRLKHVRVFLNRILYRNYHLHNETELLFLLNGNCTVNLINRKIEAKRGSVVLINPHEPHEISGRNGADFLVIQLSSRLFGEYFPSFQTTRFLQNDALENAPPARRREWYGAMLSLGEHYLRGEKNFELFCLSAVADLLSLLYADLPYSVSREVEFLSEKKEMARMERIADAIEKNYVYGITLQTLAKNEGVTVTHLSHFFTKRFGVSFREYLANLRFEHSLRLIDEDNMPLMEIAMRSGFSDPKYMAQEFKKRFGCTPNEFKKRGSERVEQAGEKAFANETPYRDEEGLTLLQKFRTEENL